MTPNQTSVVHFAPKVQAHGGIETLLEHLQARDERQHFFALFDRRPKARANYTNLNFAWWMPLWLMRRRFRQAVSPHAHSVAVYHHGWGLQLFHDCDQAQRRILLCHNSPAFHRPDFAALPELADGMGGVSPALVGSAASAAPSWTADRIRFLRVPLAAPAGLRRPDSPGNELVIGFAGRVERAPKRMDRLPEFLREMRATGRSFRFEVLGGGRMSRTLERRTGAKFHGWLPKDEFWRVLATWDAIVFFSDAEGGPLALLEGAAAGTIPFYPRMGGSLGDAYVPGVDSRCHYPAGDMKALAKAINEVFAGSPATIMAARERARASVARHLDARFGDELLGLVGTVAGLPRISTRRQRRMRPGNILPLGLLTRLLPNELSCP